MKNLNGVIIMSTTEVSAHIGLGVSVEAIERIGVAPILKTSTGVFWKASDFPIICQKLSARLADKAAVSMKAIIKGQPI